MEVSLKAYKIIVEKKKMNVKAVVFQAKKKKGVTMNLILK